jgi:REP element-mobilizing transposase RayT
MTAYRRPLIPGATYFFTVTLADCRLALLTDHIEPLRAAFRITRLRHPFAIEAVVVLLDHLHAIWTLPEGDSDFAVRWSLEHDLIIWKHSVTPAKAGVQRQATGWWLWIPAFAGMTVQPKAIML